ncbi:hypothetical protein FJ941_28385 [Mesorhizobium sp. B2-3-13]|nr:hypothetical protein FJ941_28385 [Mesorhizobium sp. B2-3-13]
MTVQWQASFCEHFAAFERRTSATFRNRHAAGAVMQTDFAGQTVPVIAGRPFKSSQPPIFGAGPRAVGKACRGSSRGRWRYQRACPTWLRGEDVFCNEGKPDGPEGRRRSASRMEAARWRAALRYVRSPRHPPSVTPHRSDPVRR